MKPVRHCNHQAAATTDMLELSQGHFHNLENALDRQAAHDNRAFVHASGRSRAWRTVMAGKAAFGRRGQEQPEALALSGSIVSGTSQKPGRPSKAVPHVFVGQ